MQFEKPKRKSPEEAYQKEGKRALEERKKKNRKEDSGMAQYRYYEEDTKEEMEGYQQEASAEEKMHPVNRMTNSYGDISFGVAANKTAVLLVSEKKRKDGKGLRSDHSVLKETGAKKERMGGFFLKTNTLDRKNSAAAVQGALKTTPDKLLAAMKRAVVQKEQETTERMLPFTGEKQKELMRLRQEQRRYLEADYQNEENRQRYGLLERQKEELTHEITKDRQEEQKMLLWLKASREKAKKEQQRQSERVRYELIQAAEETVEDSGEDTAEENGTQEETGKRNGENIFL